MSSSLWPEQYIVLTKLIIIRALIIEKVVGILGLLCPSKKAVDISKPVHPLCYHVINALEGWENIFMGDRTNGQMLNLVDYNHRVSCSYSHVDKHLYFPDGFSFIVFTK